MKRQRLVTCVFAALLAFAGISGAQTPVVGQVLTQTWTISGSPYIVLGDILVEPGNTLIIEAGVEIRVAPGANILVLGTLQANGTSTAQVRIGPDVNGIPWGDISIEPGANASFEYTLIHGNQGMWNDGTLTLANCTIADYSSVGLNSLAGEGSVKNTIIWSEQLGSSAIDFTEETLWVEYSAVQGIEPGYANNISADPRFVDAANGDYSLLPYSPCIGAGDGYYSPRDPDGSTNDMGAFPFFGITGTLSADTIWDAANSPYYVVDTLIVPLDVKLTVDPGVDVMFTRKALLVAYGEISAIGTDAQGIQFISADPDADVAWNDFVTATASGGGDPQGFRISRGAELLPVEPVEPPPSWAGISILGESTYDEGGYKPAQAINGKVEFAYVSVRHADYVGDEGMYGEKPAANSTETTRTKRSPRNTMAKPAESIPLGDYGLYGGGIDVFGLGAQLVMSNSEIRFNRGTYGGGLCIEDGATATLTNSAVLSNISTDEGGGVEVYWLSTLTMNTCEVRSNVAVYGDGGGIANWGDAENATLVVNNSTIADNISFSDGGGIWTSGVTTLDGCVISGNNAFNGGGISSEGDYDGTLIVTSTDIINNVAIDYGGGLLNQYSGEYSSEVTLTGCTISGNSSSQGGGVYNLFNAVISFTDCSISGNTAEYEGGGIYNEFAYLTMSGSTLSNNTVSDEYEGTGGGITNYSGDATLEYTVIAGNTAINGAGVYTSDIESLGRGLSVRNCTFVDNNGVSLRDGPGYTTVVNSVFWNLVNEPTHIAPYDTTTHVRYSNIQGLYWYTYGSWDEEGNIEKDPLFVDAANGDYSLLPYSRMINAGDPASPPDPDGSIADMGAIPFLGMGGDITDPMTLTAEGSPYYVTGALTVRPYGSLTVEPGVDVFFAQFAQLIVEGTLTAEGTATEGDSIRFLSVDPNADALWSAMMLEPFGGGQTALRIGRASENGDEPLMWYGISVVNGGTATVAYARVSHAISEMMYYFEGGLNKPTRNAENTSRTRPEWRSFSTSSMAKPAENGYGDFQGSGGVTVMGASSQLSAANSTITYNMGFMGGGISVTAGASADIAGSSIISNLSIVPGGGLVVAEATATLTGSIVAKNVVYDAYGGGLAVGPNGIVIANECTFDQNTAPDGGGVYNLGTATFINSTVNGNTAFWVGGGVLNEGALELVGCDISGNTADGDGGGLFNSYSYVYDGEQEVPTYGTMVITECAITENTVFYGSGSALYTYTTSQSEIPAVTMTKTLVARNVGHEYSGAIEVGDEWEEGVVIDRCTFVDNAGYSIRTSYGEVLVSNSIFWNTTNPEADHISDGEYHVYISYSVVQNGHWNGDNMLDVYPVFVDPNGGDYSLAPASPCIDAGDPESPRDPDGSRADIGAFYFHKTVLLTIPTVTARSRDNIAIEVRATAWSVMSAHLELAISDLSVFDGELSVSSSAFPPAGEEQPQLDYNVVDGVLYVSIISAAPVDFENETLCVINGTLVGPLAPQQIALNWIAENVEINDEAFAQTSDGVLDIVPRYGDVTDDGTVAALDATEILKYTVKKATNVDFDIQFAAADVSGNEKISSWDGALILFRVVNPEYLFPVEGGGSPLNWVQPLLPPGGATKLAAMTSQSGLMWARTSDGWAMTVTNFNGPVGADVVLRLPESAEVSSNSAFAYSRESDLVTISVASINSSAELFRVTGSPSVPMVESAVLNEAQTTVAMPLQFTLHQNAPNPFNPTTTISFSVPQAGVVTLAIYDVNGRLVRTLVNEQLSANTYGVVWNGTDDVGRAVASGVYVYRLTSGAEVSARRLTLIR